MKTSRRTILAAVVGTFGVSVVPGDTLAQVRDPIKATCTGRGEFRRKAPQSPEEMLRIWLFEDMRAHEGPVPQLVLTQPWLEALWPPGGVFGVGTHVYTFRADPTLTEDLWVFTPLCLDPRQV